MTMLCGVCVGEIQDYLDEYFELDEVILKEGGDYLSLALGFNAYPGGDWTSVVDLQLLLAESGQWEPLRFRTGGISFVVVGMVRGDEPVLIVERV